MPRTFHYEFDDLPLVIDLGKPGLFVAGRALIEYTRDVWDFSVREVEGDGEGKNRVPCDGWLEATIRYRLENEWCERVMDAIRDQIEEDRQEARERNAEYRRDESWERV